MPRCPAASARPRKSSNWAAACSCPASSTHTCIRWPADAQLKCDLNFKPLTRAQLATELKACLDASPNAGPDTWLEAVNWDRQSTSGLDADPTKTLLDSLPTTRPIVITSSDFHAFLANSRALALAGITAATPNPVGGTFLKDAQGALTGM